MIVKSIDQVREVIPVNASVDYSTLTPYLQIAEDKFLLPVLGQSFYDELDSAENPTEAQAKALKKCRAASVNYAMYHGFDMLNVTFADNGYLRSDKDTGLYRYQEENLKDRFKNDAFDNLDNLIEYLQTNASTFEQFRSSQFYTDTKGTFFPNTRSFNDIYNINNSRLVFLQIARFFDRVIDFEIVPAIGRTLYDKVVAEMKKETGSGQQPDISLITLTPYIRKPLAYLAVAYGIDEIGLRITEKGLYFETSQAGSNSNIQTILASAELKQQIYQRVKKTGDSYKAMLFNYLRDHSDQYPDFTQLDEKTTSNPYRRNNSGKKTFFA
jgi:hypothetical protein